MRSDVNIVVAGLFHHRSSVEFVNRELPLAGFYYSHKRGTTFSSLGRAAHNLYVKEYLVQGSLRILGKRRAEMLWPVAHEIWGLQLRSAFRPARLNMFLVHGNCRPAMVTAKAAGGLVVGEVVNAHPMHLAKMFEQEKGLLPSLKPEIVVRAQSMMAEIRLCDYLVAPSSSVAESFAAHGYRRDRIKVVPYGCEFQPVAIRKPRGRRVLIVAQLTARKGLHRFLGALAKDNWGRDNRIEVTIVGRGDVEYRQFLQNLYPRLEMVQHVPREKMLEFMGNFDVGCLPSLEDGFGVVVTEFMSAGVPVLVSRYAGASELVSLCGRGVVYDPYSIDETHAGLASLLDHEVPVIGHPRDWSLYAEDFHRVCTEMARGW